MYVILDIILCLVDERVSYTYGSAIDYLLMFPIRDQKYLTNTPCVQLKEKYNKLYTFYNGYQPIEIDKTAIMKRTNPTLVSHSQIMEYKGRSKYGSIYVKG